MSPPSFINLPPELRQNIYDYLFSGTKLTYTVSKNHYCAHAPNVIWFRQEIRARHSLVGENYPQCLNITKVSTAVRYDSLAALFRRLVLVVKTEFGEAPGCGHDYLRLPGSISEHLETVVLISDKLSDELHLPNFCAMPSLQLLVADHIAPDFEEMFVGDILAEETVPDQGYDDLAARLDCVFRSTPHWQEIAISLADCWRRKPRILFRTTYTIERPDSGPAETAYKDVLWDYQQRKVVTDVSTDTKRVLYDESPI
ncbi:hypothetical protein OHC33_009839 [Knufia fluminis]|uniref:Uncharacterized protein n=1 Tax=Knufia fluminis TaxID=191047 RepID=A0AAN8E9I4_9EURO|nr:hypothetical protein OHC33_009839 [Knufia fluminis]